MTHEEHAQEGLDRCLRLLANPDMEWFLKQAVSWPHAQQEEALHALNTEPMARDRAAHVAEALREVKDFLNTQKAIFERMTREQKET